MSPEEAQEQAALLLQRVTNLEYLGLDLALVRSIEDVLDALPVDDAARGPLEARLAVELRGDATTVERRRALLDLAAAHADQHGVPRDVVGALLARVHALWEPAGAEDRLDASERAVAIARREGALDLEIDARQARIDVLLGLGRITDAEVELQTVERLADENDPHRRTFAASRRSTLQLIRGRFDEARAAAEEAGAWATAGGLQDAEQLLLALRGSLRRAQGDPSTDADGLALLRGAIERSPGHHLEAVLSRALHELGRRDEARAELSRALSSLHQNRGLTWLVAAYDASVVACDLARDDEKAWLIDAMDESGADLATLTVWFAGSTHVVTGVLAASLRRHEDALARLDRGIAELDRIGALPWAAEARRARAAVLRELGDQERAARDDDAASETERVLASVTASPSVWRLTRRDDGWHLRAGDEEAHLSPSRGLAHLALLLGSPGCDVPAVVLEAGTERPIGVGSDVLDEEARSAFRQRLATIDAELDLADRRGDAAAATKLVTERDALVDALRRATGLGGRARRIDDASERARVNVTRNLRRAIDQITKVAPGAGLHLAASIRTGTLCRYEPRPGGPAGWST